MRKKHQAGFISSYLTEDGSGCSVSFSVNENIFSEAALKGQLESLSRPDLLPPPKFTTHPIEKEVEGKSAFLSSSDIGNDPRPLQTSMRSRRRTTGARNFSHRQYPAAPSVPTSTQPPTPPPPPPLPLRKRPSTTTVSSSSHPELTYVSFEN